MDAPQLCVTVTGRTTADLRRVRDEAAAHADIVELRLDMTECVDVNAALEGRRRPVIVTCRPRWEGGGFDGAEEERERLLRAALDRGAEFVDVEAAAPFAARLLDVRDGRGIVLSAHLFGADVKSAADRYRTMRASSAEVIKLAIQSDGLCDMLPLLDLARADFESTAAAAPRHVLIAMGNSGVPSRVLAAHLRNRWTYAGDGVAPGQLSPERMTTELQFRRINADSALYGVAGNPIMHSLSPVMHNAGFSARGLNAAYIPCEARDTDDFVEFARALPLRGASITTPFKISMMSRVDELDLLARRVGAINTLLVRDGKWIGLNTDVEGFLRPLSGRIGLKGVRATVLGAGGAARAVAVALADQGAAVTISARRLDAARGLARVVRGRAISMPPRAGTWDVLVNATTLGSESNPGNPMAGAELDGEIVFDLVYTPAVTPLLAAAKDSGCLTIAGLEMLVAQAERQFELWTGQRPPDGLFFASATHALTPSHPSSLV
jgi:3-dehydroquinate dehydratase/shikimate dehydrogenase